MAVPLTLDRVSVQLADGRTLFSELDFSFDPIATGLVGDNGVGKSTLARLLAGHQAPSQGHVHGTADVFMLTPPMNLGDTSIGALAGVGRRLQALQRIERGSVDPADFSLAEGHWDLRERLQRLWQDAGLPSWLDPDAPAAPLSGGQQMQVALSGAWASGAQWLLLDEPSNHLDQRARQHLRQRIGQWPGGLLVISHDRELLEDMACTVELEGGRLHRHGGPWSHYAQARSTRQRAAQDALDHARQQLKAQRRDTQQQAERAQQRQARGDRQARNANQAPILLGLQKQNAQVSAGRARQQREQALQRSRAQVHVAAAALHAPAQWVIDTGDGSDAPGPRQIARLRQLELPFVTVPPLDLNLQRGQRLALVSDNGSGKSTLLRVLAGQLPPRAGQCEVNVPVVLLDQSLRLLPPTSSLLQVLEAIDPAHDRAAARTRLALLGLDAQRITRPSGTLSAGERIKGALACVLHPAQAPGLLLLDEPGNALDLAAMEALEQLLAQYRGTLVMVSHDAHLLRAMQATDELVLQANGTR